MGERKGQNHYYPPDFNYKTHKNLNNYHGTHSLRERAAKLGQGILIIRFEMPFNVWCLGCNKHIAMGVRYNAEKKKCGMYYTTPLYEFRMKCHLCDTYFTIRTDPKNFDYELVEGCRRQERRFDPADLDNLAPVDRNFQQKLAGDAMFKAEHQKDDKAKASENENQIDKLERIKRRDRDAFSMNCELRRQFRFQKRNLNEQRAADTALKQKLSLGMDLLPSTSEDLEMAHALASGSKFKTPDQIQKDRTNNLMKESIFKKKGTLSKPVAGLAGLAPPTSSKRHLDGKLSGMITKKVKTEDNGDIEEVTVIEEPKTAGNSLGLVDYDSDNSV